MPEFYIDAAERKRIGTKWIQITLYLLHVWASICILALCWVTDANSINAFVGIFGTCTFGIAGTLIILILNKGADMFFNKLWGSNPVTPVNTTETVTKTTTVEPIAPTTSQVNDVNMQVKGDVNVSSN